MDIRLFLLVSVALLFTCARCDSVDLTLDPSGKSGTDVVEAVIDLMRSRCIFTNDRLFLRRLAYVESRDGTDASTYAPGYNGGIWKVDENMFRATQSCSGVLRLPCNNILEGFGIDWTTVTWSDLRKPLYSGLAAGLYTTLRLGSSVMYSDIGAQEQFWRTYYHQGPAENVNFTYLGELATAYDCNMPLDMAFLIDSSGSIDRASFQLSIDFFSKVADVMDDAGSIVRIAAITFESTSHLQFNFNTYSSKTAVANAIRSITKTDGGTATYLALDDARTHIFQTGNARSDARRVAVVLTDGGSDNTSRTASAAQRLQDEGVTVFAIGVGSYNLNELYSIASPPACSHTFTLDSFASIDSILDEIKRETCSANVRLTEFHPYNSNNTISFSASRNGTITINATCGSVNVYVSYTNPSPSSALYYEKFTAIAGSPAYVVPLPSETGQPVYITVEPSSLGPLPGQQCDHVAYTVSVADRHWAIRCCNSSDCRTCTDDDIRQDSQLRNILCNDVWAIRCCDSSGCWTCTDEDIRQDSQHHDLLCYDEYLEYVNPCTSDAGKIFHPYPYDTSKFIMCDYMNNPYITQCPGNLIFNHVTLTCGGSSGILPLPNTYPNPCTPGHFFFDYTPNRYMYIHCDLWGNAFLQYCPELQVWSQSALSCITDRPLFVGPTNAPLTIVNPCTPENLTHSIYFHPYPCDHTRYIHCDVSGNYYVQFCPVGQYYEPASYICVVGEYQAPVGCEK